MRLQLNRIAAGRGERAVIGAGLAVLIVGVGLIIVYFGGHGDPAGNGPSDVTGGAPSSGRGTVTGPAQPASSSPTASNRPSASPGVPTAKSSPVRATCAASPHLCGYPDAANTGWQHTGVKLTKVTADPYYITKAGAVVDGLDIHGCVYVRAKNVTIKRSKITCSNQPMVKNFEPDGHGGLNDIGAGLVMEDVEFDGMNDPDAQGVAFNNYTVRRANFHNLGAAVKLGSNVVIQDSYVHDIASTSDSHNGGFPSDGGAGITVRHNTVLMNSENGYAIAIYNQIPAGEVVRDVTIDNNLLAGGNYVLYCGAPGQIAPNLRVTNNRFSTLLYSRGGFYGSTANCDGAAAWSNNYWDDSLAAVTP